MNKPADIQLRSFLGKRNFAIDTIQSDGKILVSGSWAGCFTVVRYRADGSAVDPNFGAPTVGPNAAQVCFQPFGGNAFAMALNSGDKIIVAGDRDLKASNESHSPSRGY